MALLLDTSVAVELINGVARSMERARDADMLFLSVISHVELEAGMFREDAAIFRARLENLLERVEELEFTGQEVAAYSSIIAATGFSRRLVIDRMIAATALANDLTLATLNARDSSDIPALSLQDWSN